MGRRPKTDISDKEYEEILKWKNQNPTEYNRIYNGQYLHTLTNSQLVFLKSYIRSNELRKAYGS